MGNRKYPSGFKNDVLYNTKFKVDHNVVCHGWFGYCPTACIGCKGCKLSADKDRSDKINAKIAKWRTKNETDKNDKDVPKASF